MRSSRAASRACSTRRAAGRTEAVAAAPRRRDLPPGAVARAVTRWREGSVVQLSDGIAEEVPVALCCGGEVVAVMMATPTDLEDFGRGFALTEGLVARPGQVLGVAVREALDHYAVDLHLDADAPGAGAGRERTLEGRSGCGVCGSRRVEDVLRPPPRVDGAACVDAAALQAALADMRAQQSLNAATGATHAAAFADACGRVLLLREDVGRHNALDKLIGALPAAGVAPSDGFVVVTSRASYEMVYKAAVSGVALLAAVSAPTALAIALADGAGLTLIGFARPQGC